MTIRNFIRASLLLLAASLSTQMLAAAPRVAVTDLAYEERVSSYFRVVSAHEKSSLRASGSSSERESDYSSSRRSRASVNAKSESSYYEAEGTYSYIERGEMRKFTADIKGEILKSGLFDLIQGKPFTAKDSEKLYDIIARIKQGQFPGADYVLFGSINNIEFRREVNPIDNTNTVSATLSLELVGEFSLISTRTHKIMASFSAMGTGQDVKLITTQGGQVVLNRSKVVSEVSKSLGEDVANQLKEQLSGLTENGEPRAVVAEPPAPKGEVIIFK